MTAERDALQASVSGDRAYIRRLEHKMTAGGPDTAERCAQLRARVAKLKDEVSLAKSDADAARAERDALARDKASYSHALDLRAEEMSAEGGADVPSRLLYAVAKGREEAVSLAVQLAEKSDRVEAERAVAARLRERRDELERALAECRDALDVSRRSAVDAEARASKSRADAERAVAAAQEEVARASAIADEATAEAETVGAALTRERTRCDEIRETLAKRDDQIARDLEMLREEMELAVDATEREARDASANVAREAEDAKRRVAELEAELEAARATARCAEEARDAERDARECRVRSSDADATKAREHAAALEEETGHLTAQIEAFAVVNARLQDAATSAQSRLDAEVAKTANLKNQVATLEASLRAGRDERASGESELRSKLRTALEELATTIAQRDETRAALRETMAKCASAMARCERAEASETASRRSVENLNKSKRLLQETMVEQLAAVRAQLERAQTQNADLEAAVRKQRGSAERLQGMTASGTGGGGDGDGDGKAQGATRPPLPPPRTTPGTRDVATAAASVNRRSFIKERADAILETCDGDEIRYIPGTRRIPT